MPAVDLWESFFDAAAIVDALSGGRVDGDVVEFGCGYGTFTIPAAMRTTGTVYALDIDPLMIAATADRVARERAKNVAVEQRDFVTDGCGRDTGTVSFAMLFNIMHIEDPVRLLQDAHRTLRSQGRVGVIHWNYDEKTPRGPSLDIRPRPEQCQAWGIEAGLVVVALGMVLKKA